MPDHTNHNNQLEIPPPNISRAHSYARTRAYIQPEAGKDFSLYREAHEHPLTNRWFLREVWIQPNTQTAGDEAPAVGEEGDYVPGKKDLSLGQALQELAQFERQNQAMGFQVSGAGKEEIGTAYFENVVYDEGMALDILGRVHPTVNGRIVTAGMFAPETKDRVQTAFETAPMTRKGKTDLDLSSIFRTHAQVDDFARLLERRIDLKKWDEFYEILKAPLERLCYIQGNNYRMENYNVFMSVVTEHDVRGAPELRTSIKKAEKEIENATFLKSPETKKPYFDYLQKIYFSYELGHAKKMYKQFQEGRGGDSKQFENLKTALLEQTKKVSEICREIGGSEEDVQRARATIIDNNYSFTINDNDTFEFKINRSGLSLSRHDGVIFVPEEILDFLIEAREIRSQYSKAVAEEDKRIQMQRADTAPDKNDNAEAKQKEAQPRSREDMYNRFVV